MFAIFKGARPRYRDYIFCGNMEHSTKKLFYAVKGKGCYVILENGKKKRVYCSTNIKLSKKNTRIYADTDYDMIFKTNFINRIFISKLKSFKIKSRHCSGVFYVDLASGKCDLVLECTRKGNLEIAVAYGMVKEAGGYVLDLSGGDIGAKEYLVFGQKSSIPIISSCTKKLGREAIKLLEI